MGALRGRRCRGGGPAGVGGFRTGATAATVRARPDADRPAAQTLALRGGLGHELALPRAAVGPPALGGERGGGFEGDSRRAMVADDHRAFPAWRWAAYHRQPGDRPA